MLTIEKVDTENKSQVKRFVQFYYDLYQDCPEWVPPLYMDAYLPLNRKKHPFYQYSEADFFLAVFDGKVVGRICVGVNKLFNEYHKVKKAQFYFFDCIDDIDVARELFEAVFKWARRARARYADRTQGAVTLRRLWLADRGLRQTPDDDHDEL